MTPTQMRAALAVLLADVLGSYALKGNPPHAPAIHLGDPPSDWDATGLEVIVRLDTQLDAVALQSGEHNLLEAHVVRLIKHGSGDVSRAARRIVRRWPDATVREVPENTRRGILAQRIITIPN